MVYLLLYVVKVGTRGIVLLVLLFIFKKIIDSYSKLFFDEMISV